MLLQETFRPLYTYESRDRDPIVFYDVQHFVQRAYERGYGKLHLPFERIVRIIADGARKIDAIFEFDLGHYMVHSESTNIKLPIIISPDRKDPDRLVGLCPTVLFIHSDDYDLQRPEYIDILVESYRRRVEVRELEADEFITYYENGEAISSFDIVNV